MTFAMQAKAVTEKEKDFEGVLLNANNIPKRK